VIFVVIYGLVGAFIAGIFIGREWKDLKTAIPRPITALFVILNCIALWPVVLIAWSISKSSR